MQFVSWAALLTLLVRDLAEMRSTDAAAAVRKDRLHPRQGNEARPWDPLAPSPSPLPGGGALQPRRSPFPRKNCLRFGAVLLWAIPSHC